MKLRDKLLIICFLLMIPISILAIYKIILYVFYKIICPVDFLFWFVEISFIIWLFIFFTYCYFDIKKR